MTATSQFPSRGPKRSGIELVQKEIGLNMREKWISFFDALILVLFSLGDRFRKEATSLRIQLKWDGCRQNFQSFSFGCCLLFFGPAQIPPAVTSR